MKIGIDFDNTIANYEGVFYRAALKKGWIPESLDPSKTSVRNYLREKGLEENWIFLQGYVYGTQMNHAQPYPGIETFLSLCKKANISCFIISHKTKTPLKGPPYDLHQAAQKWLKTYSYLQDLPAYFEVTLQKKLQRIHTLKCDYFIDDLPEVFNSEYFPKNVSKILFDPSHHHTHYPLPVLNHWEKIFPLLQL